MSELLVPTQVRITTSTPTPSTVRFVLNFVGEGTQVTVDVPARISPMGLSALLIALSDYLKTQYPVQAPPPTIQDLRQ